ncbi:MAG: hypothetical protein HUN04_22310 [Desulfobacter sp.]|nr:MAG: hypothetical protein HUN04_22310 [Desulfobacter sp.]
MNPKVTLMLACFFITGCAMTYETPKIQNQNFTAPHNSSKTLIVEKAKRVLLLEGFQIQSIDDNSGFISTSLKNWRLTPNQANCGTTMGIDYLKDKRTKTEVAFNVIVDDKTITILSNIQGEYKPGAVDQDITLSCRSKGIIEAQIGNKILK